MKILIDLTALADNFSGLERYALNISKNLIKLSNKDSFILVFKNSIHKEFEEFNKMLNVEFRILKGDNKLIFNQIILPYNIYKIKADKYLFLAFPSPILFRRKGIYNTIHDLTAFLYPETMKKSSMLYFKYSIINAIKVSEKIITVSKTSRNDIIKKFGRVNIEVVSNGISDVFDKFIFNYNINEEVKKKYELPKSYIMSLGTLEPRKNIRLLIEAYISLKKSGKISEKLLLVGRRGWKMDDVLGNMDIQEIEDDIIFTGFVDDDHLPYIYNNSKVFVFPSIYEGFGIPPIEAMYMETKVLLSDIDVLKEVGGEKVQYFKSCSMDSLKENLLLLLNDNSYDFTKNKDRARKFSWSKECEKIYKNF